MDDVAIARALHVLSVVLWIGGVGFVTTVLLPAVGRLRPPGERVALFDQIERRFAWQARLTTTITGLTGFYMVYRFNLWDRYRPSGPTLGRTGMLARRPDRRRVRSDDRDVASSAAGRRGADGDPASALWRSARSGAHHDRGGAQLPSLPKYGLLACAPTT
jgi:hypothetical protein